MSATIRHELPLLAAGQAQKEVTHNEALLAIDRQLHLAVLSRALTVPPEAPAAGSAYIVPSGADGAWAGHSTAVASHDGFGWTFVSPIRGCLAWIVDEGVFAVFDGGWSVGGWPVEALKIGGRQVLGATPVSIANPSGGVTADIEVRAVLAQLLGALRGQGIVT